jgi:protein-S-isoprenylcysteine O-methyltransferase Ste14
MTHEAVFRLLTILLMAIALGISGYFRRQADDKGGRLGGEGQRLLSLLRLLGLLAVAPLLGYLVNPVWVSWARLPLPLWLRWLGIAVAVAMLPLLYWILSTIGRSISPTQATREGHQLVTGGPYRYVRHPLYTVGMVFWLALALITAVWPLAVGLGLAFFIIFLWRTPREEANLIEAFGDEYLRYMDRTGRYLPRFR